MGKYAEHCNFVEENIFATMCAVSTQQEKECPPQHKLGGGGGEIEKEREGVKVHISLSGLRGTCRTCIRC